MRPRVGAGRFRALAPERLERGPSRVPLRGALVRVSAPLRGAGDAVGLLRGVPFAGSASLRGNTPASASLRGAGRQVESWPADKQTAYKAWSPAAQNYFWSLTDERQDMFWRLTDGDKETLAKLTDTQRETAWAQIKTKLDALSS